MCLLLAQRESDAQFCFTASSLALLGSIHVRAVAHFLERSGRRTSMIGGIPGEGAASAPPPAPAPPRLPHRGAPPASERVPRALLDGLNPEGFRRRGFMSARRVEAVQMEAVPPPPSTSWGAISREQTDVRKKAADEANFRVASRGVSTPAASSAASSYPTTQTSDSRFRFARFARVETPARGADQGLLRNLPESAAFRRGMPPSSPPRSPNLSTTPRDDAQPMGDSSSFFDMPNDVRRFFAFAKDGEAHDTDDRRAMIAYARAVAARRHLEERAAERQKAVW